MRPQQRHPNRDATQALLDQPATVRSRTAAVAGMSVLVGVTIGMTIAGLDARFDDIFAGVGHSQGAVFCATLTALAIGVRIPRRLAMSLGAIAGQCFLSRRNDWDLPTPAMSRENVDRPLLRIVLSVIALLAGIATALLPLNVQVAASTYHWMHVHFLWSTVPLAALRVVTVLAAALIPLTLLGLVVSCTHHLTCRHGQWDPKATGWLLIGAALGTQVAASITAFTHTGDSSLIAAGLPTLLVAFASAGWTAATADESHRSAGAQSSTLPGWIDRRPTLLRASVVAVAVSGAYAAAVWNDYLRESTLQVETTTAVMVFSLGAGALAGCSAKRSGLRSIGGFGVACAAAGVIAGTPIGLADGLGPNAKAAWPLASANLAAMGFAIAYGHQTLLNRVAARSSVGATILGRTLVACGLTLWIAVPVSRELLGPGAALAIIALSLPALGGTLIILEPDHSPGTRRLRLCAILGSIGAMIALSLLYV